MAQPGYQSGSEPMWWWKVAMHLDEAQLALSNAMAHNLDDQRPVFALQDCLREGQAILLDIFRAKGLLPAQSNGAPKAGAPVPYVPSAAPPVAPSEMTGPAVPDEVATFAGGPPPFGAPPFAAVPPSAPPPPPWMPQFPQGPGFPSMQVPPPPPWMPQAQAAPPPQEAPPVVEVVPPVAPISVETVAAEIVTEAAAEVVTEAPAEPSPPIGAPLETSAPVAPEAKA